MKIRCEKRCSVYYDDELFHLIFIQIVDLPFVPYPGLVLDFSTEDDSEIYGLFKIDHVYWTINKRIFECEETDDVKSVFSSREECLKEFAKFGWTERTEHEQKEGA